MHESGKMVINRLALFAGKKLRERENKLVYLKFSFWCERMVFCLWPEAKTTRALAHVLNVLVHTFHKRTSKFQTLKEPYEIKKCKES